jgi:hypothetical protein
VIECVTGPEQVKLYGGENWTIKARDATRLTTAEMKYVRTEGCT